MHLPTIVNASVTTAESSVDIPVGTRQILMQCRTAVDIKFAFASGGTASLFGTVKAGSGFNLVLSIDPIGLLPSASKIYLLAGSSVTAEIIFAG